MARALAFSFAAVVLVAALAYALAPSVEPPARPAPGAPDAPVARAANGGELAWDGPDALVTRPPASGQSGYAETTVALDPANPSHVVMAAMDFARDAAAVPASKDPSVHVWTSDDGGATWADRGRAPFVGRHGQPLTCADPYTADPSLAYDGAGEVHLAYLSYGCSDAKVVAVVHSADGGATWGPASIALVSGDKHVPGLHDSMDREWIAYDPQDGGLVMTWTAFLYDAQGYLVGYPILSARSHDAGRTWGEIRQVGADFTDRSVGANVRVAPDGTLVVAYPVNKPMAADPNEIRCPDVQVGDYAHLQAQRMMVAVSTDGGRSYARHDAGPVCPLDHLAVDHPFANGGAWYSHPGLALDPATGAIYVAWSDRTPTGPQTLVKRSDDGGSTWTLVHASGSPGVAAFLPQMVANGSRVVLFTLRETSAGLYDAAVESSDDAGASWSAPRALNDAPMCSCFDSLKGPARSGVQFGHYVGLDAKGGRIVATWMDNRDPLAPQTIHARAGAWS